ncbi:MAG: hypothetical protein LCH90_19765, partial [Proteobacteria bacterium]|nr:hypothetical protein [Pseudomonadota bacterium]
MDKDAQQAAYNDEFNRTAATGDASRPAETGWDFLGPILMAEFDQAFSERRETEIRWLQDLRQYKGIYEPDVMKKLGKRSKAYAKRTQTKVRTANARMLDLLFPAGGDRNYLIDPTPKPTLPRDKLAQVVRLITQAKGQAPTRDEVAAAVMDVSKRAATAMMTTIDDQLADTHYKRECKKVIKDGN